MPRGQNVFLPLGVGMTTDIDEKQMVLGKDINVINSYQLKTGELVKRFGHAALGSTMVPGGASLRTAWQLATYGDALVNLQSVGAQPLLVYSPSADAWSRAQDSTASTASLSSGLRGPVRYSLQTVFESLDKNTGLQTQAPDVAYASGYVFVAYQDTTLFSYMRVFDATTGALVYKWKTLQAAIFPRVCVTSDGYVSMFYYAGGIASILADVWQIGALGTGTGIPVTFVVGGTAATYSDAVAISSTTIAVAYRTNTNKTQRVDFTPSTGFVAANEIKTTAAASIDPAGALAWMSDPSGSGRLAIITAGPAGVLVQWDLTGGTPVTSYVMDAGVVANVHNVTGHTISAAASGEFNVLYDVVPGGTAKIRFAARTIVGGVTAGDWLRSVSIASKTFRYGSDNFVLIGYWLSAAQQSTFLVRVPTDALSVPTQVSPLARIKRWNSGGLDAGQQSHPANVVVLSSTKVIAGIQTRTSLSATSTGVDYVTIEFDPITLGPAREVADTLYVPGGVLASFDGVTYEEEGFSIYPEQPTFGYAAGAFNGIYWYAIVYYYVDNQGNKHRSLPSVPVATINQVGQRPQLTIPTCRLTGRVVMIEVYRGAGAGITTPLQLVTAAIINDTTVDSVTFTDTVPDATVAAGEFLYTTGGVLGNDPVPGFSVTFPVKNRIFGVSMDNPEELWFSNELEAGSGPTFSETNVIRIVDEHGPIIGGAGMDDKVIVFKSDAIYAFTGDGPNNLGQGTFGAPQLVVLGTGTSEPQTIVPSEVGVWFNAAHAKSGIQLLDRSLSLAVNADGNYIGSPVQSFNGQAIATAIAIPERKLVRFYLATGTVLVYDLIAKIWTTDVLQVPLVSHAVNYGGRAALATLGSKVLREDVTGALYTDDGATYTRMIESPWVQAAGIRGFERLKEIQGVGEVVSDSTLVIAQYVDFNSTTAVSAHSFSLPLATRPRWDWDWKQRAQRFGAVKFVLTETAAGAGAKISGLALEVATKPGIARRGATARAA